MDNWLIRDTTCTMGRKPDVGGLSVGRYVSEAWFGRKLARHPPANRRVPNMPARQLPAPAPSLRHGQPEPRPERTRPAGTALIVTRDRAAAGRVQPARVPAREAARPDHDRRRAGQGARPAA